MRQLPLHAAVHRQKAGQGRAGLMPATPLPRPPCGSPNRDPRPAAPKRTCIKHARQQTEGRHAQRIAKTDHARAMQTCQSTRVALPHCHHPHRIPPMTPLYIPPKTAVKHAFFILHRILEHTYGTRHGRQRLVMAGRVATRRLHVVHARAVPRRACHAGTCRADTCHAQRVQAVSHSSHVEHEAGGHVHVAAPCVPSRQVPS